jgi:hypothetical protein
MSIKRFDICVWRKYEKDGEEKKQYTKIGTLVEFSATEEKPRGFKLELPIFGHEKFAIFEQKPRETAYNAPERTKTAETIEDTGSQVEATPEDKISTEDIPFN